MRIAIDARLNAYRQGGIPQYTRQLLTALAEVAHDDQFITLQHRDHLRPLAVAPNVTRRTALTPPHHRFEQWMLPLEVLLARPNVLHCPDFIAPVRRPCPAVVTIHDLAFMHYPEILDDAARAYYGQIKTNAARADGIIAVSETTRQDIAQFLDIPIEEISVIYEAAAPLYGRLELRESEARVLNATPVAAGTFMLFVSTLEPRKNLPTLLHALRICLDRRPDRSYRLVVAGARGWRDETIFATARDLKLADHVLFVGAVGQYDLRWLYNACRLYINPSLYEGFGLPLLEAMACGAACLAAATSSLPEIGGDAALYIPPLDAGLWADAIEALWDDQERREELGRLGRVQAQHFSWLRAARQTLKVYERAIERAHPATSAPAQLPRRQDEPEPLPRATPADHIPGVAGEPRACLRCGTAMLSSQLQRGILIAQPIPASDDGPLVALAWFCPRCGHVELVVEQAAALVETTDDRQPMTDDRQPLVETTDDGQLTTDEHPLFDSASVPIDGDQPPASEPAPPLEEAVSPDGAPTPQDIPPTAVVLDVETPAEPVAPLPDALERATQNGKVPPTAPASAPTAEQSVASETAAAPKKPRQPRSKRKRSP
jgi:glycosyltransferase involved in cell wall biosynthesis